jgi:hypothetical protein
MRCALRPLGQDSSRVADMPIMRARPRGDRGTDGSWSIAMTSPRRRVAVRVALPLALILAACGGSRPTVDFDHPDQRATGSSRKVECVRSGGVVACRGLDERGLMGTGRSGPPRPGFVAIEGLRDAVDVAVAGREAFACALRANHEVWCWGTNLFGVLGDRVPWFDGAAPDIDRSIAAPGKVDGLPPVVALAVDAFHACAMATGGAVYCWGVNGHGQVADPRRDGREAVSPPCKVPLAGPAVRLVLHDTQSCALLESEELVCWGGALPSALGGGPAYAPTVVGRDVRRVSIDRERGETCMLTAAGTTCWSPHAEGALEQFYEPHIRRAVSAGCAAP